MLSVEVQKATGLKDTQTFGAQDPYLKVSLHAARGTSGVGTAAGAVQAEGSGEVEAEASDVGEQLPGCVATTGTAPGGGVATRLTYNQLVRQVLQGDGNMPAFGRHLSPYEVTALVSFLHTLHPENEPPSQNSAPEPAPPLSTDPY